MGLKADKLALSDTSSHATLDLPLRADFSVFVRDSAVASWDGKRLVAHKAGVTELYVTNKKQMLIVPVEVGSGEAEISQDFQVVESPISLGLTSRAHQRFFSPVIVKIYRFV